MAHADPLKRYFDAGLSFTAMTKKRAEQIAKDLLRAGEIQRTQVQSQVEELLERSRRNSDHLVAIVRKEVASQLDHLSAGLRDQLRELERRVNAVSPTEAPAKTAASSPTEAGGEEPDPGPDATPMGSTTVSTTEAPPAKKAPAKRATRKKASPAAEPDAAAVVKEAAPKKAAPKKTATTRARAKKAASAGAPAPPAPSDTVATQGEGASEGRAEGAAGAESTDTA